MESRYEARLAHRGYEPGQPSGGPWFEHRVLEDTEIKDFSALCVLQNSALNSAVHGEESFAMVIHSLVMVSSRFSNVLATVV